MKVLIIEDELHLAEAVAQALANEGHEVTIRGEGRSGLKEALTEVYEVVILDIMLPDLDGYQILQEMRMKNVKVPVLMLTARSQLEDKLQGFSKGADDYLTKPFEMKELLARIGAVTRREVFKNKQVLEAGNLRLHVDRCSISSSETGKTVKISAKEMQVLEIFMHNPGQIITRERITERVWGYDSEIEYNNADVYISFLRKKMKFVGASVEIHTVRGLGYLLEEANHD